MCSCVKANYRSHGSNIYTEKKCKNLPHVYKLELMEAKKSLRLVQLNMYNENFTLMFSICMTRAKYEVIYLFGVLRRFQYGTGHITTGSWKGRGNQYIQFVRVLYCKLPTNGKQLPAFPLEAVPETEPWPQRWDARVLQLFHRGPQNIE